jgi:hypothetical protein
MKDLRQYDRWRIPDEPGTPLALQRNHPAIADVSGAFGMKLDKDGPSFVVIASSGDGWDHVSVSVRDRTPTWEEMDRIKRVFFKPGEVAMQLHVAEADHVNCHPFTLHLWRPHGTKRAIPLPPKEFV